MPKGKKIFSIFLLLILSIGLIAGTRLVKQTQEIREKAATTTITICPSTASGCDHVGGDGLQVALERSDLSGKTIYIKNGLYRNPYSNKTVSQLNFIQCANTPYSTSFLIKNKSNFTVRGESVGGVVILGDHINNLAIENSQNINIDHLTLATNGGTWRNGIGDASLTVTNSTGSLTNSIVTANKTSSNSKLGSSIDQEGIYLEGPSTYFDINKNVIANNFHTGVMLSHGANAKIRNNYIRNNGNDNFFSSKIGHGITTHDDDVNSPCSLRDENFGLKVWSNIIYSNNGYGIYIRGKYEPKNYDGSNQNRVFISHNTTVANRKGIFLEESSLNKGINIHIHSNLILGNAQEGLLVNNTLATNIDSTSNLYINNNDSFGNSGSNYSVPSSSRINYDNTNLSLVPKRDGYFCLKGAKDYRNPSAERCLFTWPSSEQSPLLGKGNNGTDISSYSSARVEDEFDVSIIKDVYGYEYSPGVPDNPNIEPKPGSELYKAIQLMQNAPPTPTQKPTNAPVPTSNNFGAFNSFIHPDTGLLREQIVRGGTHYIRERQSNGTWDKFEKLKDDAAVYTKTGSGEFQAFAAFVHPIGNLVQTLVRNNTFYRRERVMINGVWSWTKFVTIPSSYPIYGIGSGKWQAFASYVDPADNTFREVLIRGGVIWQRQRVTTNSWTVPVRVDSNDALYKQTGSGDFQGLAVFKHPSGNLAQEVIRDGRIYWRDRGWVNGSWQWGNFSQLPDDAPIFEETNQSVAFTDLIDIHVPDNYTPTPWPTIIEVPAITPTSTPKPTSTSTPKPTNTPIPTPTSTPTPTPTICQLPGASGGLSPSGNVACDTTSITFRWNVSSGANSYAVRVDDQSNPWSGDCNNLNNGDSCQNVSTNSYTRFVTPGRTYRWWVHSINSCGWTSPTYEAVTIPACPTSTPIPTATSTPVPTSTPTPLPTATNTPTSTPTALLGDINNDRVVNILDYTLLSNTFGSSDAASDINSDGVVNILDYTLLSNNFGAFQ